jgi:hypothetical protein
MLTRAACVRVPLTAILAFACHAALAQTVPQPAVPATVTVQQLAPQLVAFAGSPLNFQSLVTGLAQGTPVQLVTVLSSGLTQLVTFTPGAPLQPADIVNTLERARQQLIGLGIATPTAEQLAVTLMGGNVPTALGSAPVAGLINAPQPQVQNRPSPAAQIQGAAGAGATAPAANPTTTTQTGVNVQLIPTVPQTTAPGVTTPTIPGAPAATTTAVPGVTAPVARPNTSDSSIPAGSTSASPIPVIPPAAPGLGSLPRATEAVRPGQPAARN